MAIIGGKQKKGLFETLYVKMNQPKSENKVVFFRLLAVTQKAGLGVRDSLETIIKSENHPGMKKIIKDTLDQINEGIGLADALAKYDDFFEKAEIELIRSSEQMGNLPETLDGMSIELEKFEMIKKKLKSAMMYPIVMLSIASIAVVILLVKVIPSIIEIFPKGISLPDITLFVMSVSAFLQTKYMLIIAVVVGGPILYTFLYNKFLPFKIIVDRYILKIPTIGPLIMTFYRYRFSKLLGDFYSAGLSPIVSFEQIANIFNNYHYKKKVEDVKKDLEIGLGMTESFEGSWLFNPILIQIIGIGEKSGNIGEVLDKMAGFYREEVDVKVEGLTKMIEPLLMVFVSGIVGVIVGAIFMPMVTLLGAMGQT